MTTKLRDELREPLLQQPHALPTRAAGRLPRAALATLRGQRIIRRARKHPGADLDLDALVKLVSTAGQLKGLMMKVGQILSYIDVALPPQLQQGLAVLQTHAQPMPFPRVARILRQDLGAEGETLAAEMERAPLAAASIGQVHRARTAKGVAVAVKVRYPEIDEAIRSDFAPAALGTSIASLLFPNARLPQLVAEVRARLLEECDYLHEAKAQRRFAEIYDGHPLVVVPRVFPTLCGTRVLTTELVQGQGFEDYLAADPPQPERDALGVALFRFYVGTIFSHSFYHCDPHPGNYLFLPGGRVAILDYGCTRVFSDAFVARLRQLTRAVHADRREALHQAFCDLGLVRPGQSYDFDTARSLVRAFYGPMLQDVEQPLALAPQDVGALYRSKIELMKLTLPGEFVFLFRIRFGLLSVLARLGARANWYRLEQACLGR